VVLTRNCNKKKEQGEKEQGERRRKEITPVLSFLGYKSRGKSGVS